MLCSGLFLEIGKFIVEHHRKREALEMVLEKVESHEELAVQGMTLRAARTDDIEAAVDLFNAAAESLIGVADKFSVEDNQQEWSTPGFNLETDTRVVVAPDGSLVGYYEVWDIDDPHVSVSCWGYVHPDYTGMGIGTALLDWAERRARQAVSKAPPGTRVIMRAHALTIDQKAQTLFQDCGFEFVRHGLRMVIDLDGLPPDAQWPDSIVVRTLRVGEDERAVVQAVRESFQDHWGFVEHPFEDEYARWMHLMRENPDFDPLLWFLAMDGDEIAGVSLCWPKTHDDAEMGWVGMLGVRRPWRRRGLALALLHHSFAEFYRRGLRRVGLGVDAQSLTGATRLYQKAGMRPDAQRQFSLYEKELRPGKDITTRSV
jgi:mycothiol synthase